MHSSSTLSWPPQMKSGQPVPAQANALLLADREPEAGKQRPLLEGLSERETALVTERGRRRVLYRGATLFTQETP
ncbi:MAG TPA: Crp/Fnr family transcriptional regulator, partial [Methylobacterium sp.]